MLTDETMTNAYRIHMQKREKFILIWENLDLVLHTLETNWGLLATDRPGTVMDTDANKDCCFALDYENEITALKNIKILLKSFSMQCAPGVMHPPLEKDRETEPIAEREG